MAKYEICTGGVGGLISLVTVWKSWGGKIRYLNSGCEGLIQLVTDARRFENFEEKGYNQHPGKFIYQLELT